MVNVIETITWLIFKSLKDVSPGAAASQRGLRGGRLGRSDAAQRLGPRLVQRVPCRGKAMESCEDFTDCCGISVVFMRFFMHFYKRDVHGFLWGFTGFSWVLMGFSWELSL